MFQFFFFFFFCFLVTGNILGNSRLIVQRSIFLFFSFFFKSFSLSLFRSFAHSLPHSLSLFLSFFLSIARSSSTIRATMAFARSDRHDDHWSRSLIDMSVGFYPVNCVAPAYPRESVVHRQPSPYVATGLFPAVGCNVKIMMSIFIQAVWISFRCRIRYLHVAWVKFIGIRRTLEER